MLTEFNAMHGRRLSRKTSWAILWYCLALSPNVQSAPDIKLQPQLRNPLQSTLPVRTGGAYKVSAPACVKAGSTFSIVGKGLSAQSPRCAVNCGKGPDLAVTSMAAGTDSLKCSVNAEPTGAQCMLGAKAASNWLVFQQVSSCHSPEKSPPLAVNTPPILQRPLPQPVKAAPLTNPGAVAPPQKAVLPSLARPGLAASQATELRHTVPFALTMTGLGNTSTRVWQPLMIAASQSLTMRGLGDAATTRYEPINQTLSTPLTMRGLYNGEH